MYKKSKHLEELENFMKEYPNQDKTYYFVVYELQDCEKIMNAVNSIYKNDYSIKFTKLDNFTSFPRDFYADFTRLKPKHTIQIR